MERNSGIASPSRRLIFLMPWASRAAGGIFDAMRNLTLEMTRQHRYLPSVIGLDDPNSELDRPLWGKVETETLKVQGPRAFGYAPDLTKALELQDPELLHVHGLWMYTSVAAVRWSRRSKPYIVSPHGMLDPWALNNSRMKKRLSAVLYENRHLRGAACLHALNDAEAKAIRDYGLNNPVCVIPNGVELPDDTEVSYSRKSPCLLYLGRLHPKKGLPTLIEAWSRVRTKAEEAGWQLKIAGWDQGGHRSDLEAMTEKLCVSSSISFVGPQFGEAKAECFRNASAFILPSLSEGLPMSILEAWSWRLPVVMTPNCNLPEGAKTGAAIMAEPEVGSLAEALCRLFSMGKPERETLGARGRRLVEQQFQWPRIAEQVTQVYDWILGFGPQPAFVLN
jgi:glycosyltransferase involved in cell wall biosynthesis